MRIKNSLVNKFIWKTTILSIVIAVPFIFGNLYIEYRNELTNINNSLDQFERSGLNTLSMSVWFIDRNHINKQLEGLVKSIPFASATLDTPIIGKLNFNSQLTPNGPSKTFELKHDGNQLGKITIQTSLDPMYKNITLKFLFIFISVFLNTTLLASLIIYLFRKIITLPLLETKNQIQKVSFNQSEILKEKSYIEKFNQQNENLNELESVNESIKKLQNNFQNSYSNLLSTQERLNDILNFSSDAIFETDSNLILNFITFSNNNNLFLVETFKENSFFLDIQLPDEAKTGLISHKSPIEFQFVIQEFHYNIVMKAIFDKKNEFNGYRGIIFNITQQIEKNNKIKIQNEQIHQMQKITAIGELTASLAHDFRNFLSIIIYTNEWILRRSSDDSITLSDEKLINHIKNAQAASYKADSLITKLLNFSRRHTSIPESVNIYDLIINLKEMLHVAITKRYGLEIIKLNEIPNTLIDVNLFESAILNLCVNAKDALGEKGKIVIEISQVHIEKHSKLIDGKYVLLKFSDNGKGIPVEIQNKIFEPFFTTKDIGNGTGLGLSMINNFMLQSKGTIEVQSLEKIGTSFYLYFPIA